MTTTLKIRRPRAIGFVIAALAHIVGEGNCVRDEQDPDRWRIEPMSNNWWARVDDGVLTISGRYADEATMQAVKQMLLFRCDNEVSEL